MKGNRVLAAGLFAGTAWSRESGAVHPFAKYKDLPLGENAISTTTITVTPTPTRAPLECFQVAKPVLTPAGVTRRDTADLVPLNQKSIETNSGFGDDDEPEPCAVILMEHTFANSYGAPFVGKYTPPDCEFDRVVINFTTLVRGRQYDRTGVMYLGDTEVWRTSTAEPTSYGIRWEWLKDMTAFLSLWKKPQTVIFDLENIVDDTYTGLLNTTLAATFFIKASDVKELSSVGNGASPADLIIPISQRLGGDGKPSQFVYPEQAAKNTVTDFPRNANRAVFTVDVKGQANEEFWWSNILQSSIFTFNDTYGQYPGYSPFREVQVLVDDHLAGVSWPFPVIYTGGVVPQLHRPIVGVQAFDIAEHEIDISPFLPLLCDGQEHTFAIKIVGLDDDGQSSATLSSTTDDEWYMTGKIFVWLDDDDSVTTGTFGNPYPTQPTIVLSQHLTQNSTGANETLEYNLSVSRTLSISSQVKTQKTDGTVTWSQSLTYSNIGGVSNFGNNNLNAFTISGADAATLPGVRYSKSYAYPLFANSTAETLPQGNLTLLATVDQGLRVEVRGESVFPTGLEAFAAIGALSSTVEGSMLNTWRNGTASYYRPGDNSYSTGVGQTHQVFSFGAINAEGHVKQLYHRDVSAYNDTVTDDHTDVTVTT
ncbi:peptide N-acetyl-beta-D-glucosaminyl asparaginase amidase A-domain-containing protein [Poronia punctata]|nr:peptide N-acetyl-beta-D-glucosaminyl asparaginase amidase A-domain-containing protein [Poronia punctata]